VLQEDRFVVSLVVVRELSEWKEEETYGEGLPPE
jgi:hypothetical protein